MQSGKNSKMSESGKIDAIENLKTELNEVKLRVSECRKKGFDMGIATLKMMNIPSKIRMAEITRSQADIEKAKRLLSEVKDEIDEVEKKSAANMEKEINILISKINELLDQNNGEEAKKYYIEAVHAYKQMQDNGQEKVFKKLEEARRRLIKI
jgi:hypothetical protein